MGELVHVPVEWKDSTQQFLGTQKLKNVLHYFCVENTQDTRASTGAGSWRGRTSTEGGMVLQCSSREIEEKEDAYQAGGRLKIQASWWPRPIDASSVRVPLGTSRRGINWGID